jgi:hypothetical protein
MKYMLMMHAPRGTGDWQVFNWPPADLKAHIDFMHNLNKELADAGELVGCEGYGIPERNYLTTQAARLSSKQQ